LLTPEPKLVCGPVQILSWGKAIELVLGDKRLRLYRDIPVNPRTDPVTKDWILVDPDCFISGIAAFARLESGQTFMVGRGNDSLDKIFEFPKSVKRRHLELANDNGEIIIKPLASFVLFRRTRTSIGSRRAG
jgi:hypothetical protein